MLVGGDGDGVDLDFEAEVFGEEGADRAVDQAADQDLAVAGFALVGAGLSCVFPVVLSAAARTPGVPPSAAIAAVCTVGYLGFLIGPPTIGGLAELLGLPAALALVVALCVMIAALGSRVPRAAPAVSPSA